MNEFDVLKQQLQNAQNEVARLEKELKSRDKIGDLPGKFSDGIFVFDYIDERGGKDKWVIFKNDYVTKESMVCLVNGCVGHQDIKPVDHIITGKMSNFKRLTLEQANKAREYIVSLVQ